MRLDRETIARLAGRLEDAARNAKAVAKLTEEFPGMDLEDAYAIQSELRRRKEAHGHKTVGFKIGLASRAEMKQMGEETPIYGFLADDFACPEGAGIGTAGLIHPRVEAGICFVTKAPLQGPGCHIGAVLAATDFVMPAIEVIDSRYLNFKFDLRSAVADNASSARFVTSGRARDVNELDLQALGVVLEKNGEIVALGAGAAVLGHPAAGVARLANLLAEKGEKIPAGALILSGGITEAVAVAAGDSVTARFQDLGSVSVRFI